MDAAVSVEKFSFATLFAARMTGPAVPGTAPPAPTFECRLRAPGTPWGDAAPRGFIVVVGYRLRPPRHTCTARTPYSNALSLEARRYTPLTLSEYGAPTTEVEGVPV